ncbi:MAG: MoaD/ThiS family protein [Planctomycetota bacterium]
MTRVRYTENLHRHVDVSACPGGVVDVGQVQTVREALEVSFRQVPHLRGYVLDEGGELRHHLMIFVDGSHLKDRRHLTDSVTESTEIDVIQALSGG